MVQMMRLFVIGALFWFLHNQLVMLVIEGLCSVCILNRLSSSCASYVHFLLLVTCSVV
jgi:hypothetical protein